MSNEFENYYSFRDFQESVQVGNRFLLSERQNQFLKTVAKTSLTRVETLDKEIHVFRAQKGHDSKPIYQSGSPDDDPVHVNDAFIPFKEVRMRPRESQSIEGRANSKGQSIFYCASDKNTAIAETRPWVGAYVSLATFSFSRPLRIVDCSQNYQGDKYFLKQLSHFLPGNKSPIDKEESVWHDIDWEFSKPVTRNDDQAEYLATQILAELFRNEGLDGIAYKSSVGSGKNLAVFDLSLPLFKYAQIAEVTGVTVNFNLESEIL